MAKVRIPDDVLHIILIRLAPKTILRCRCVSKHWNNLISDPYFMKKISRRMILLPCSPLVALDEIALVNDTGHSMLTLPSLFEIPKHEYAKIVGAFNGIILFLLRKLSMHANYYMLYYPFTRESKEVPDPPMPNRGGGIGFGASFDDFKIVRFCIVGNSRSDRDRFACDVFSVRNRSWITLKHFVPHFLFYDTVGKFVKGFLHWFVVGSELKNKILALDVTEMVLSEIDIPCNCEPDFPILGELHGCLCMINRKDQNGFNRNDPIKYDMWVMKEHGVENSWSKAYSFTSSFDGCSKRCRPMCVLEKGIVILVNLPSSQVIIYDILNDSYKILALPNHENFENITGAIKYTESMVSPSNMCFV